MVTRSTTTQSWQSKVETDGIECVGCWPRVGAALIDAVLLLFITAPLVTLVYGRQDWSSSGWIQWPAVPGVSPLP